MPEQITKHPEVTLEVLKGAGAVCGQGSPQKILTQCPPERFCSLPTGELCIYGLNEIQNMTQITAREIASAAGPVTDQRPADAAPVSALEAVILAGVFVAGIVVGRMQKKSSQNRES